MLRYWAKDKFRSWNKRLIALFVMLSMLLPDLTTFAEPNGWTTDTQSPVCGYIQHEHTDACYEEVQIPGDDSGTRAQDKNLFSVHHHTADCYDGNGNLTCGLTEDKLYHKHTDSCRDEEGNIICGLAENELYIEPEIRTERQLTCGLEEHIHGPDCYKEAAENVLTADQSETPNNENEIPGDAVSETDQTNDQDDRAAETTTDPADGQTADETKEESESADKETAAPLTDGTDDTEVTTTDEKAITQATDPETTDTGSAVPEAKASEATETEETTPDHSDTEPTATDKTETETTEPDTTEPETTEPKSEENETDPADGQTADETTEESESTDKETTASLTDGADDTEATTTDEKAITQATDPETTDTGSAVPEAKASEATESEETTPDHSDTEPTATDKTETETAEPDTTEPETTEPKSEETDSADAENPGPESVTDKTSTDQDPVDTNTGDTEPEEIPVFEIREDILIRYNGNDEVVTIPDGIRKIDKKAFYNNKTIVKAILPDSVEIINSSAFAECPNLEQIILSDNSRLGLIGEAAFKNDKKLDTSFAANVDRIVANAFDGINTEAVPEEEQTSKEETDHEDNEEEKDSVDSEEETGNEDSKENKDEITAEDAEPAENNETAEDEEKPEDEEASGQDELQDEEETPETEPTVPDEQTAQAALTLSSDKDAPYQVAITFPAEAGIPEGTELVVAEQAEPQMRLLKTTPKKRDLLGFAGTKLLAAEDQSAEETYASIPSLTTWNDGDEAPEIILFQKTLDISLVAGGEEIEPDPGTKVTVSVYLPEIEDGQEITVRHLTDQGPELLESTNNTGTITFTTDSFSLFEFTSTAQRITSWTSDLLDNTLFGRSGNEEADHNSITIDENSIPDGFSILEAFSTTQSNNLWLMVQRIKDLVLGKLESIALYAVEDGKLAGIVKENIGITDVLRFNLGNYSSFALVRDSGLRRRIEDLGNVILSGLMPKNGLAEATDVTEEYADFVPSKSVEQGEADETSIEQGETVDTENGEAAHTIAAYDISIKNDGEEYQPEDKPIEVTIKDEAIAKAVANGNAISLWHVLDDGTSEQVENFMVSGDTVTFSATGFSVYVLTETTVEKVLTAADGNVYKITVTYDGSAQIPEGAELVVTEVAEDQYLSSAATVLGVDESYLLYRKFLDISFIDADGAVVEPATPVKVKIELLDVNAGADKLQVVHFGTDGAEEVQSQVADGTVIFESKDFSVYGFWNVLEPLASTETEEASIELLGFGTETQLTATDAPEVEEGLAVLASYNVDNESQLWIKAELKEGVELTDMESVAVYSVKDSNGEDEIDKAVEELVGMDTITELPTTEFAVIKDSGYRHLSFNLTPDEEDNEKTVTLDGMMPKMATAEAADVTELYSTHEFTESAPIYNEETGAESTPVEDESGEKQQGKAEDDAGEEEQEASEEEQQEAADDHTTQRSTIAAYDISISNNSVDYQPDADHPVSVVITDERILPGSNLELWHIKDDGTEEKLEDFSITAGTLSFTATGFSTYALVSTITTYYQTASGETYKITVEYGEDADLPEGVELRITEVDADEYLTAAATALGADEAYLLYKKFFDISFMTTDEDGEHIIEPNAPVNVTIELLDVTAGAEKLQVVHFGETGAEKVTATATEKAVVSFTSSEFSVYGVGNVLTPIATAETNEANIEILGFSGEAELSAADTPAVEEGLEVLGAYNLSNEAEKVWIKADVKDGVELSSKESVVIYTIKDSIAETPTEDDEASTGDEQTSEVPDEKPTEDQEAEQNEEQSSVKSAAVENGLISELVEAGTVAELTVSNFALVKDTGYRHLSFEISVGGEEAQAEGTEEGTSEALDEDSGDETANVIILDGMMPKLATAEAVDVTEAYVDHEYVVPEEDSAADQEHIDELNTEAEGEEVPEEQPVSNDAGEGTEEPAEQQDSDEEPQKDTGEPQEGVEEEVVPTRTTLAAFNITVSNNNAEYQPDEAHPITVEIRDSRIVAGENIELWHIKDDGTEEKISEFTVEDGRVEFSATGFSVYTIVQAPVLPDEEYGWIEVASFAKIAAEGSRGFYLDTNYYYLTGGEENSINGNTNRHGLSATSATYTAEDVPTEAGLFYFEAVDTNSGQFYVYKQESDVNYYVSMNKINNDQAGLSFVSSSNDATVFTLELVENTTNRYRLYSTINGRAYYWNRNTKGSGNGAIAAYFNRTDPNVAKIRMRYYAGDFPDDPYDLDGKTYSIVYHEESVRAAALTSNTITVNNKECLDYQELLVRPNVVDDSGELLIAKDADLREWTFENIRGTEYYISTTVGAKTYYIRLDEENLRITDIKDNATAITITAGTGEYSGKYNFSAGGYSITHIGDTKGTTQEWFKGSNTGDKKSWLNLATRSSILTDEDFTVYSAEKVDLSDRTVVPDGSTVVVYTRKWNDTEKKYEFYVVGHDGSVMRAYESGDVIQWVGSNISTAEWDFTEYHYDDGTPNYYYELQNTYSGQYIAPQVSGDQILQGSTIGINLNGRRYGYYYSTILAWDDDYYSYVGLKLNADKNGIVSCPMSEAEQFYFAILKPISDTDELTTVTTVDNIAHGIKVKMIDLEESQMTKYLGGRTGTLKQNLLSTNLNASGYPTAVANGESFGGMYSGATSVNHLFIENTYYSSGYYEFDSTQNFASFYRLNDDGTYTYDDSNFTVYHQLGTHEKSTTSTVKHGQFLPYNKIVAGLYSAENPLNLYSALADYQDVSKGVLPDSDPRKGQKLHLVEGEPDFQFAMELEATFTQTLSGLDAWGHDIIYEFTGDDDFWLYVDGELIIDLGGTHSALAGSVNYRTGEVYVSGTWTTIRDLFIANRQARGESTDVSDIFEQQFDTDGITPLKDSHGHDVYIFKDYTQHTMKIFYMERGAGASNLHMRFNLASVKPGTVELSKQISGVDDTESFMAEYPFQIFFKSSETGAVEQQLETLSGAAEGISVKYKDSTRDVTYKPSFTTSDGSKTYSHVYMLKPGETAVIDFPDNTYEYRIVECFLNTEVYESVNVNGAPVVGTEVLDIYDEVVDDRKDYNSGYAEVSSREKVTFDNHVIAEAKGTLTFTKHLYNENGVGEGNRIYHNATNAAFRFRLYLGTENDTTLPAANMHSYHVKDENGNYCKWDYSQNGFVSLNTEDLSTLSAADKTAATFYTSMNGTTDKIPVDYTVEVREIPAGTKYKVEERYREVPDGYSLLRYLVYDADTSSYQETGNSGKNVPEGIISAVTPNAIEIDNMKGWGIRVQKKWSDEEWMQDRDPIYFALYENNNGNYTIVSDSVTQLSYGEDSVYWFIQTLRDINGDGLKDEEDFKLYEPHEVIISSSTPTVDDETGIVTNYGSITSILNVDSTYTINGKQIGETSSATYTYVVLSYEKGELADGSNVRVDTITNKRAGIELYKRAWDGTTPLGGAVFTLTYEKDGKIYDAGAETYTSDATTGYITTAYLQEGREYTLTEIASPDGYQGIQTAIKITRDANNVVSVSNVATTGWSVETNSSNSNIKYGKQGTNTWWTSDDTDVIQNTTGSLSSIDVRIGQIDIRNKPYTIQFVKTEPENNGPLAGVTFALYPQAISSSGDPRRDYLPVTGYENLVTDSNGIIPKLTAAFANGALDPGTYYMYEVSTLPQYRPLSEDVKFTVSETGTVTIDSAPSGVTIATTDGNTAVENVVTIPNALAGTVEWLYVKKVVANVTWEDKHTFDFRATLYLPDGITPWNFTNENPDFLPAPFINGVANFSMTDYKTDADLVLLKVPLGAVVKVTEEPTIAYTTNAVLSNYGSEESTTTCEYNSNNRTSTVTINDNVAVLLTYTNTRRFENVTVKKELKDELGKTGTFAFTGRLMDYDVDITDQVIGLSSFSIDVNNNSGTIVFSMPVRSELTVTEQLTTDQAAMYTTSYNPANQKLNVTGASTITVTNTRRKQTVTITKELRDNLASGAISFPFTVTLSQADGTTPITSYQMYSQSGTTIKTGDGKNGTTRGVATFNLSVTNYVDDENPGTASQTLTVPYGAVLKIEEGEVTGGNTYNTAITKVGTSTMSNPDTKTAIVTVTDNPTIKYTNTLLQGKVDLIISKTVEDLAGGSTAGDFTFEVSGMVAGDSYDYTPQTYDGSAWVDETTGSQTADENGKLSFTLQHHTRVKVEIPVDREVTVSETNNNGFTPSYRITHGTGTPGNSVSSSSATVTMDGHKTIDFTNTKGVVAPTSFSTRHTPFLLLLLFGLMLLIGGGVVVKRRRGDDPDTGDTAAVNTIPTNTGPPGSAPPRPPTIPKSTYSTTDPISHVRWRNSVWVEEHPQRCGYNPTSRRGYIPPRKTVTCPQAKLWMNGGGDAG